MPFSILLAAAAAGLPASDVDVDPIATPQREIVVTATRARQNRDEVGQALTVLDRRDIELRQLPVIADLLSTTPGVSVTRNGGPGQTTAVRLRGAEDTQTLVVIDGVRVNDPSAPGGAFDFANLLTGNISRIEVLRGPNSVPWGSQAIGGVVNIVTGQTLGLDARAEYGANDQVNLVGQYGTGGPLAFSLGGGYFRDDGISAYRFGTERDGYRQYAGNARLEAELTPALSLDLRAYYANSRVAFDGFPPPAFAFADTGDFGRFEQLVTYAGLNWRVSDRWTNRLAVTLNDVDRRNFDSANPAPTFTAEGRVERVEYQGEADLGDALRTVFGAEHERSRFDNAVTRYTTGITSGYLQLIATPFDALTLTAGARVDDHRSYGTEATVSGNAALRFGDTVVRFAYGEGFKAPTLFQLFSAFGNTDLRPEEARSIDLGVEQRVGNGRIGVTLFQRNTRNQIDFAFAGRPDRPFGFYDNLDRTRARGVEAFAELRPSEALTLLANYNYVAAIDRASGEVLLRRPRHTVNGQLDWSATDRLKLGASVQLVSDSRDLDFQSFAPVSLDGYVLAGLRASLALNDQLEVYGRVENLFDAAYETVSGYGTLGRNAHIGVRVRL